MLEIGPWECLPRPTGRLEPAAQLPASVIRLTSSEPTVLAP